MKNLDQDLQEANDQKMLREKIIIHVAGVKNQLQNQTEALALLEIEINKSETVLEALEQLAEQPLRKIFNKILGNKKQQVERERQNYLLYILRHQMLKNPARRKDWIRSPYKNYYWTIKFDIKAV